MFRRLNRRRQFLIKGRLVIFEEARTIKGRQSKRYEQKEGDGPGTGRVCSPTVRRGGPRQSLRQARWRAAGRRRDRGGKLFGNNAAGGQPGDKFGQRVADGVASDPARQGKLGCDCGDDAAAERLFDLQPGKRRSLASAQPGSDLTIEAGASELIEETLEPVRMVLDQEKQFPKQRLCFRS